MLFERDSKIPYRRLLMKALATAVKRALKPFLLLLICSLGLLALLFFYTRYHAFELPKSKIYATTTPHQPIAIRDSYNITQSKNETQHGIIEEKKSKRKENLQMKVMPKPTNPEISTVQNSLPRIQLNISVIQQKPEEEPKRNRIIQVVNHNQDYDDDGTTIENDIDTEVYRTCSFKVCSFKRLQFDRIPI